MTQNIEIYSVSARVGTDPERFSSGCATWGASSVRTGTSGCGTLLDVTFFFVSCLTKSSHCYLPLVAIRLSFFLRLRHSEFLNKYFVFSLIIVNHIFWRFSHSFYKEAGQSYLGIISGGTCLSFDNLSLFATVLVCEGIDRGVITHLLPYNWTIAKLSPDWQQLFKTCQGGLSSNQKRGWSF